MVAIVELIAASDEPVAPSAIARQLDLNLSTCTAILRSLEAAGWVRRDDDRRHRLGSGLLPVVEAVRRAYPLPSHALEALEALSAEVGHGVTLTRIEQQGLVIAASAGPLPYGARAGDRFPLTPPYGLVAKAWAPRDEFDEWLGSSPMPLDRSARTVLRQAAKAVRERGWVAWRMQPAAGAAVEALRMALASAEGDALRQELLRIGAFFSQAAITPGELAGTSALPVAYLLAPVGSPAPTHQLELHVLATAMRPAELRATGERLRQTASLIAG